MSARRAGGGDTAFVAGASVLALLVRLAWVRHLTPAIVWFDGEQYVRLALGLLQHGRYLNAGGHPSAFWPPGYPAFLALVFAVAGPGMAGVRAAQALLGALTVPCVHGIARRALDARGAKLAALAAALYPIHVYAAGTPFPATLLVAQYAAVLWLLAIAAERRAWAPAALAGALGGWAVLTAGSALPAMLVCAAWLAWRGANAAPPVRAAGVRLAVAFLLPLSLVLGGWTARNVRAFGTPVLVSTNGGYNFWLGNYPGVQAETGNGFVSGAMEAEANAIWFSPGNEAAHDAAFWRLGRRHVGANVPGFLGLTARKALHLWAITTEPLTPGRPRLPIEALGSWLSYGLLLPFALAWLLRSLRRDAFAVLALGLVVVHTLVHAVVLSKVRFRLPLDALVIVYGAGGVVAFWDLVRAGRRPLGDLTRPN